MFTMPDQIACTRVYRVPVLRPSSFPCAEGFTAPDPSHANAPQRDCLSVDHANNEDTLLIGRPLSNDDSSSFEFPVESREDQSKKLKLELEERVRNSKDIIGWFC